MGFGLGWRKRVGFLGSGFSAGAPGWANRVRGWGRWVGARLRGWVLLRAGLRLCPSR